MSLLLYCDLNDYSSLDNSKEWNMANPSIDLFNRNSFPTTQTTNSSLRGPSKYYLFTGNSYVDLSIGEIEAPFTVNFWVYLSIAGNGGNILKNTANTFNINILNQKLRAETSSFNYTIPLSTWININLEYTVINKVRLSVNGVYTEEITRTNTIIASSSYKILETYSGGLSWLRVYDDVLSTDMIKGLYESCMTLSEDGMLGIENIEETISLTEEITGTTKNSINTRKASRMVFHGEYASEEDMTLDELNPYIFPANETYYIKNVASEFSGTVTASGISIPNFSLNYTGNLIAFIINIKPSSFVNATISTRSGATSFNSRTFTGLSTSSFNTLLYLTKPKTLNIDTISIVFSASSTIQYENYRVLYLTSSGIENYLENINILLGAGTTSYFDVTSLLSWCDTNLKTLTYTNNVATLSLPSIAIQNTENNIFNTSRKYGGTAFIANEIKEFIFPE